MWGRGEGFMESCNLSTCINFFQTQEGDGIDALSQKFLILLLESTDIYIYMIYTKGEMDREKYIAGKRGREH